MCLLAEAKPTSMSSALAAERLSRYVFGRLTGAADAFATQHPAGVGGFKMLDGFKCLCQDLLCRVGSAQRTLRFCRVALLLWGHWHNWLCFFCVRGDEPVREEDLFVVQFSQLCVGNVQVCFAAAAGQLVVQKCQKSRATSPVFVVPAPCMPRTLAHTGAPSLVVV